MLSSFFGCNFNFSYFLVMWAFFHICRSHLYFSCALFVLIFWDFPYQSFAFLLYLQDFLYIVETETFTKSADFPKLNKSLCFLLVRSVNCSEFIQGEMMTSGSFFYLKLERMRYSLSSPVIMPDLTDTVYTLLQICVGLFLM